MIRGIRSYPNRCSMFSSIFKTPSILFSLLVWLVLAHPVYAQMGPIPRRMREDIKTVIEDITGFRFASADEKLDSLANEASEKNRIRAASFLLAYKHYWRYRLSPYLEKDAAEFETAAQTAIEECGAFDRNSRPEERLFVACSHLFLAMYYFDSRKVFESAAHLRHGISEIEQVEENPLYRGDIAFIRGCYLYYKNRTKWREAAGELDRAINDGFYFQAVARYIKARIIEAEDEENRRPLVIYRSLCEQYPRNTLFVFSYAKCLHRLGMYEESVAFYGAALRTITYRPLPLELMCDTHFSLGQIFEYHLLQLPSAVRGYAAAHELADPSIPETERYIARSLLHLGQVYAKMDMDEEALRFLDKIDRRHNASIYRKARVLKKALTK